MGITPQTREKGCHGRFTLVYPHELDDKMLSMYAQGMQITEISKVMNIPRDTIRKRLLGKGCNPSSVRFIKSKGGYRKRGRLVPWTDEMVKKLIVLYPNHSNIEIAEILELTERQVKQKGHNLGLRKDAEWLKNRRKEQIAWATFKQRRSPNRFLFQKGNTYGKAHWFQKGNLYGKEYWDNYRNNKESLNNKKYRTVKSTNA